MIIRVGMYTNSMAREESEIYIGRKPDGTLITVTEYAACEAGLDEPPPIFCQHCLDEHNEMQQLTYDAKKRRFLHRDVQRGCYQDGRTNDRDHPLIQQTVYKQLVNDDRYSQSKIEFPINRWNSNIKLNFDVGGMLPDHDSLQGVLVEIQHQSGTLSKRLFRRLRLAQKRNYGAYVVFSPSARYRSWYSGLFLQVKGYEAEIGKYKNGAVELGTMIQPEDDISALQRESLRARNRAYI